MIDLVLRFWNILTHLDQHLAEWSQVLGGWLYAALFLIIFCETGLVVTPILPGDSLLFAVGALCSVEGAAIELAIIMPLLVVAAVAGDAANYWIGHKVGPKVFTSETSWLLNKKHLLRTQEFYEKYGGKTIIIARFIPIIRTFAPFVAGIGQMRYRRFFLFNAVGGVLWICLFVPAGYLFGNLPFVKKQFHLVIFGIIFLSILPAIIEFWRSWRARSGARAVADDAGSA